jgi:hypothetical protein
MRYRWLAQIGFIAILLSIGAAGPTSKAAASLKLTGSQSGSDILTTTAGNVTCKSIKYSGTVASSPITEMSLTPTYSECTAFGFPATIDVNGCSYLLKVAPESTGTVDIVCPAGQELTVTASPSGTTKCTLHVPGGQSLATATFHNLGSGSTAEIEVTTNLSAIKYSHTQGSGIGSCPSGSATNGTYKGKTLITGEEDKAEGAAHVGVSVP